MKLVWNWQNTGHFWQNGLSFEVHWQSTLTSGALYWMKQLLIVETNSVRNRCSLLRSLLRLWPGLQLSFEHNIVRKKLFLSASFCWDSRPALREMDQKFKFGGTPSYGDSHLEFLLRHFKVFRLHAILLDAAGVLWAHSGRGPGFFYMIGRGPNSCSLGHVIGLLVCLCVKLFLPSIFNSVDFWSSMSCLVLDIELADENVLRNWEFLLMVKFRDTHSVLQKSTNPQNKRFGAQETCMEFCGTVDVWITVSLQTFFLELERVNTLEKEQKNARFLAIYMIKRWKIWKIMAVPKFKISLMKKFGFAQFTHSDTKPHFTVESAKQTCLVTG